MASDSRLAIIYCQYQSEVLCNEKLFTQLCSVIQHPWESLYFMTKSEIMPWLTVTPNYHYINYEPSLISFYP